MRWLIIVLASCAMLAPAARAEVPAGNLLANPGAEEGAAADDAVTVARPLPGWTPSESATQVHYIQTPDPAGFPDQADSAAIAGGTAFFAGGPLSAAATIEQDVDVTVAAAEIDAGSVEATLGAFLGGFVDQADSARVIATFLSADSQNLGEVLVGPVGSATA